MEPINSQKAQSPAIPASYDDYLQLCQLKGIDPQLDKPTFDSAADDQRMLSSALSAGQQTSEGDSSCLLQGISNEQMLRNLGIALHLEELIRPTEKS